MSKHENRVLRSVGSGRLLRVPLSLINTPVDKDSKLQFTLRNNKLCMRIGNIGNNIYKITRNSIVVRIPTRYFKYCNYHVRDVLEIEKVGDDLRFSRLQDSLCNICGKELIVALEYKGKHICYECASEIASRYNDLAKF